VDPVIIMHPVLYDNQPASIKVDLKTDKFMYYLKEFNCQDQQTALLKCPYVVFESGRNFIYTDAVVEAGKVTCGSSWCRVTFSQSFGGIPTIFAQVLSARNDMPVITRL